MIADRHSWLKYILIVVIGIMLPLAAISQEVTDPEAEYTRIRAVAQEGKYEEAEKAARSLVNSFPSYGDARILLGRIHAWQGEYDEALAVIDTLLLSEPENSDALDARKDIRKWARDSDTLDVPASDIRAGYSFDTFSDPYNRFWQIFSVGTGRRFEWGSASAGINVGHLTTGEPDNISKTDLQLEAEAWPKFTSMNYAYIAYAFSPGTYFPKHRAALEVWQTLPVGFAVSAGINYYYFDRNVFIVPLSVEKYLGSYWLSARGYLYFKDIGVTTSLYLTLRRYFNRTDYLQLTAGTGTAPDEPFDIVTDLERQSATSIRLSWFDRITPLLSVRAGAGYSYEKYAEGTYRNRFEGNVSIIYSIGKRR